MRLAGQERYCRSQDLEQARKDEIYTLNHYATLPPQKNALTYIIFLSIDEMIYVKVLYKLIKNHIM